MLDDNQLKIQKRLKLLGGVFVSLLVVWFCIWLYQKLSMSTLTVTTNNPKAYVTIDSVKNNGKNVQLLEQVRGKISVKVTAGNYEIAASYESSSVSRIITVKSWQKLNFNLNPPVASSAEPVYGNSVSDVTANNSQIIFIDNSNNNTLSSINSNNTVTELYQSGPLVNARWANSSLGLASNYNNDLFLIKNDTVSPVNLPFASSQKSGFVLSYDITSGGQIYVSQGTAIYLGSILGNFKKIYTSKNIVFGLSATPSGVVAFETSNKLTQDLNGKLIFINKSDKVTRTDISGSQVDVSPDGKYMVVYNGEKSGNGFAIYSSSFNQVSQVASSSSNSFGWGNNDLLYYNQGSNLLVYDISSKQSSELSQVPDQANILGIYPAESGPYIYLVANSTNPNASSGSSQLFRVSLNSTNTKNSSVIGISVVLPTNLKTGVNGYCYVNYVNFTQPTITIGYPGAYSSATQNTCLSLTQNELNQYYINPSVFQYNFLPQT
jgi:hypothetical protein